MSETLQDNYQGVFDGHIGFGEKPAVIVIDFMAGYVTPQSPFYSPPVIDAVAESKAVIEKAREAGVPVIYTIVYYQQNGADGGIFVKKVPALLEFVQGSPLIEIPESIKPGPKDVVLVKQFQSAFFGTPLASMLNAQGRDTIILTGCSTSGCVRATAQDGMQYGFRVIVPRECVGDRRAEPHDANLFDINAKMGDVVSKAEVLNYLDGLAT